MAAYGHDVDRGWAWMVLAGAAITGCITSTGYVVGLFNIVFLEVFQEDKFTTSWIGSLASSLVMLAGVGIGLTVLPCVIAVGNHFDKYRNLAFGIYSSSIGLGTMFFPPLVTYCIEQFGWRGATLILGGCCLHFLITAACLRPADKIISNTQSNDLPEVDVEIIDQKLRHDSGHHSMTETDSLASLPTMEPTKSRLDCNNVRSAPLEMLAVPPRHAYNSQKDAPIDLNRSLFSMDFLTQSSVAIGSLANVLSSQIHARRHEVSVSQSAFPSQTDIATESVQPTTVRKHGSVNDITRKEGNTVGLKHISLSLGRIPQSQNKLNSDNSISHFVLRSPFLIRKKPKVDLETSDLDLDFCDSMDALDVGSDLSQFGSLYLATPKESQIAGSTDTKLFTVNFAEEAGPFEASTQKCSLMNPGLLGLAVSQFLFSIGMSIAYLHLPVYVLSQGTSAMQSASLICVIGVCSVIVRFLGGAATSNKSVDDTLVYIITSFIAGIVLGLAKFFCAQFASQLVFSGLFGFFANGFVPVIGPLTIRYVGLSLLGAAYSIQLVVSGIGYFIGGPLAGFVFDVTGSYSHSFYIAGVAYIIGALIMIPVWIWGRRKESTLHF